MMAHLSFPLALLGGGLVTAMIAGVKLYINSETEEQYIQTSGPFEPRVLHLMVARARAYGYELMDEFDFDGVTMTHWLEQVVFAEDDSSTYKRGAIA